MFGRAVVKSAAVAAASFTLASSAVLVPSATAQPVDVATALSMTGFKHIAVDDAHQHVFLTSGKAEGVVVRDFNGSDVTVIGNESADGLALVNGTMYVSLPAGEAIAAIDTATLTETARIPTGTGTCPTSLAELGDRLWFATACGAATGRIGVVDLSQTPAAVTVDAASGFTGAPIIATAAQLPTRLFAATPGLSPASVTAYDVEGTTLTPAQTVDVGNDLRDMAITADGQQLVVAANSPHQHPMFATADLSPAGQFASDMYPNAVSTAAGGYVAGGVDGSNNPDVFVFAGSGELIRSYDFGPCCSPGKSTRLANAGLAFSTDTTHLFAVTSDYNGGAMMLRVLHRSTSVASELTLTAPASKARASSLTVSGTLSNKFGPIAAAPLTITKTDLAGVHTLPSATSRGDGTFSFTDTPAVGGTNTYTVAYAGDDHRDAATKSVSVAVSRAATTVTVATAHTTYNYSTVMSVTAHLGKTFNRRTVSIYATPYGGTRVLLKSGTVDANGNLQALYRMKVRTTFTAKFDGDYRYAPASASLTRYARAGVTTKAFGYYTTSGSYRIFHQAGGAGVAASIAPNKADRCARYHAQRYASGSWVEEDKHCFTLDSASNTAAGFVGAIGPSYRVRVEWPGDLRNVPTAGPWIFVRFTK